jgi:LacI family transcriptional regulator
MKRTTIKDLAQALQVNVSTVSRALNNHPDVSDALREKIKQLAEALHYTPNLTAVYLQSRKTKTIGLILAEIGQFFIPSVIQGITSILDAKGYKLVILASNDKQSKEADLIKMCCYTQMDGIMLSLSSATKNLDHLAIANEYDIPIILFDKIIEQRKYSSITINDASCAEKCTSYLLQQQCKHILGVFGNKDLSLSINRLNGFTKAFGIKNPIAFTTVFAANIQEAKQLVQEALQTHADIDGMFCMSDEVLIGATSALHAQQKLLTIRTVCISDGQLINYHVPPIAYMKHDGASMGHAVAIQLLHEIEATEKVEPIFLQMDTKFVQ